MGPSLRELGVAMMMAFIGVESLTAQTGNPSVTEPCQEILKVLDVQVEAWNRGDIRSFMDTYWKSPELTFSAGGATTRGWEETLERYQQKYDRREKMGRLDFDHTECHRLSEDAAYVIGQWQLSFDDGKSDSTGSRQGNFSLVMRKIDGKWVIVHDHSSERVESDDEE